MLLNPKPNTQTKILNTPPVVELQDKSNTKTGDVVYTNSNDPPLPSLSPRFPIQEAKDSPPHSATDDSDDSGDSASGSLR